MGGVEAIRQISAKDLGTAIIVLTSFATDDDVFPAIKAGALGYLLKDSEPEGLVRAIQQVHQGEPSLHPSIARRVLLQLNEPAEKPEHRTVDPLTHRELDVLKLVAGGLSNKEIADQLVVTESAVEKHVTAIFEKLDLERDFEPHRRVLAVLTFLRSP